MDSRFIEMYRSKSDKELEVIIKGGINAYHKDALDAAIFVLKDRGYTFDRNGRIKSKPKVNLPPQKSAVNLKRLPVMLTLFVGLSLFAFLIFKLVFNLITDDDIAKAKKSHFIEVKNETGPSVLTFTLNDSSFTIPAGKNKRVPVIYGGNIWELNNEEIKFIYEGQPMFLNPNETKYYFSPFKYFAKFKNASKIFDKETETSYYRLHWDGKTSGEFVPTTEKVISGYTFGLDQANSKMIKHQLNEQTATKFKLYSVRDYRKEIGDRDVTRRKIIVMEDLGLETDKPLAQGDNSYSFWLNQELNKERVLDTAYKSKDPYLVFIEFSHKGRKGAILAAKDGYQGLKTDAGNLLDNQISKGNYNKLFRGYEMVNYVRTKVRYFDKVKTFPKLAENQVAINFLTKEGKYSKKFSLDDYMTGNMENHGRYFTVFQIAQSVVEELQ
jgi:hypothetical protein